MILFCFIWYYFSFFSLLKLLYNSLCTFVYFIIDFVLCYLWMLSSLFWKSFVQLNRQTYLYLCKRFKTHWIRINWKVCKSIDKQTNRHKSIDKQQIYSIDVYTDIYIRPFSNDLFRLLPNCFLLFGCVNITDIIGWFSMNQLRVGTRTLRWGVTVI